MSKQFKIISRNVNSVEVGVPGYPDLTATLKLSRANKNSTGKDKGKLVNVVHEVVVSAEIPVLLADGSMSRELVSARRRHSGSNANATRMIALSAIADALSKATFSMDAAGGYAIETDAALAHDMTEQLNTLFKI